MNLPAVLNPRVGRETWWLVQERMLSLSDAIRSEAFRTGSILRGRRNSPLEAGSPFRQLEGVAPERSELPPHLELLLKKHGLGVASVGGGSIAFPYQGQVIKLRLQEPRNLQEFVSNLVEAAKLQAGKKNNLEVFTAGIPGFPWEQDGKQYFVLPPNSFPNIHQESLSNSERQKYNNSDLFLIELEAMVKQAAQEQGLDIKRVAFYNDMANVAGMQPKREDLITFLKRDSLDGNAPRRIRCGGTGTGDINGRTGEVHELSHVKMERAIEFLPEDIQAIIRENGLRNTEAEFWSSGGKTDDLTNLSKLATLLAQKRNIIGEEERLTTKELLSLVLHGEMSKLDEGFQTLFGSARTSLNGIHSALNGKRDNAREILNLLAQSLGLAYARMDTALNSEVLVPSKTKEDSEMVVGPGVNILRHGGFLDVFYEPLLGDSLLEIANKSYKTALKGLLKDRGLGAEQINDMLLHAAIVRGQKPTGGPDIGTLPMLAYSLKD
jgi:CRISPR/Cas system CMR-associated protein Cmr5 small subunit